VLVVCCCAVAHVPRENEDSLQMGEQGEHNATYNHYVGHKNRMITREAQTAADLGLVPLAHQRKDKSTMGKLDSRYSLSASLAVASNHHVILVVVPAAPTRSLPRIAHQTNHALDFVRQQP
jgi:hypothetical protein